MDESNILYWKRILKAIADRNRACLNDREYRNLVNALESKADVPSLRQIAIDTATALGRRYGRRLPQQFVEATLNIPARAGQSLRPSQPTLTSSPGTRFASQESESPLKPRRRPAPPRS